jgi:hypothetical protein
LPEEFFDLDRLRELDISYNRFKTLPACICSFIDLEKINITGTCEVRGMYVMSLVFLQVSPRDESKNACRW